LRNGSDDIVIAPTTVAFRVRDSLSHAIKRLMYRDVRRRKDDPRPELPEIRVFRDNQPDIEPADWDGADRSRVAVGCEVRTYRDAVFLGFNVGDGQTYKVLRFSPQLSFYLVNTLVKMERDGALKDLLGGADGPKH